MKKYISFIVLASFVFSFSFATLVKAKDGIEDDAVQTTTTATTTDDSGKPHPLKELRDQRQEMRGELKDIRQEDRVVRQEDRAKMQEDRQIFRTELQKERKDFLAKLKTEKDTFMAEVKAKKEEWKTAKADRKAQFCEAARNMMTVRVQTVISQLETFQGKVADIITQLKADGKDTADAQTALDLSKSKLADAKAKLASLKGTIPADCASVTPEQFQTVKVGAREVKDLLKESREALHEAVKDIRNLKGEDTSDDKNKDSNPSTTQQ